MNLPTDEIEKYATIQNIAKATMEHLKSFIREGVSEKDIVNEAENYLKNQKVNSFWYYGIGAFVFVGDRTTISISGREYVPSEVKVRKDDVVTVDLSPEIGNYWGDFARTFVVCDGEVEGINSIEIKKDNLEIYDGIVTEEKLHNELKNIISEKNTFEEVFTEMNLLIDTLGYENLDFAGNLGHTIEKNKDDRLYIEAGNKTKLKDINLFTFEPHIRKKKGKYGLKKEDIYYFQDGALKVL